MRGGAVTKDSPWDERLVVLGPRGNVTREGLAFVTRLVGEMGEAILEITDLETRKRVCRLPLERPVALPEHVRRDLVAGTRYGVTITVPGAPGRLRWSFRVTDGRGLEARLAAFPEPERSAPHVRVLTAAALLHAGFHFEAWQAARATAEEHPDRQLPQRLVLRALEGLGLGESFVYGEALRRFDAATE
jgi:hypothetical protein